MLHRLPGELRFAARRLLRERAFTASIAATLAITFAGSTAIFGALHDIVLRPLPLPEPDALVAVRTTAATADRPDIGPGISYPNYRDLRDAAREFTGLAAFTVETPTITAGDAPATTIRVALVAASYLPTLGVHPAIGRGIAPEDDRPNAESVVVLSDALWRSRFGASRDVIGTRITLDGTPHTVVGVMPPGFGFPDQAQAWSALGSLPGTAMRGNHGLQVVGRLRHAGRGAEAEAELRSLAAELAERHPRENAGRTLAVQPLHAELVGNVRPAVLTLAAAIAALWLIGCLNILALTVARAMAGAREIAVRAALGATAADTVARHLTEGALLASIGALGAAALTPLATDALRWLTPASFAPEGPFRGATLIALALVAATTAIVIGLVPVAVSRGVHARAALGGLGKGTVSRAVGAASGRVLVVIELALAVALLFAGAVLARSLHAMQQVELGFDPEAVLVAGVRPPPATYAADPARVRAFYRELLADVRDRPEVERAAVAVVHPLQPGFASPFVLEGAGGEEGRARIRPVTPEYFATVGLPLRSGRDLTPTDRPGAAGAVVVNEAFVRRFLGGERAIGRAITRQAWLPDMPTRYEIVGVVADERFGGPRADPEPALYLSFDQVPLASANLVVRTRVRHSAALSRMLQERVWSIDRHVAPADVRPLGTLLAEAMRTPASIAVLVNAFAGLALLLAALGLYGLLAFIAATRQRELAVRLALGATPRRLFWRTVGGGLSLAGGGVALGLAVAALGNRLLAPLLFAVDPADPLAALGTVAILLAAAALAVVGPARRVLRLSPAAALQED